MARSSRKKRSTSRKSSRKRSKARRGMRGLGDLLSQRATSIALKVAKSGRQPNAAKIEAAAANSLCREGHAQYCEGRTSRRVGRPARVAAARYAKCVAAQNQRAAMGLKPRDCTPPAAAAATPATATVAASNAKKPSKKKAKKSEARAESNGCVPPKGRVCMSADVGKIGKKRRKGCDPGKPKGNFYCTPSAVAMHKAGKNIRAAGKGAPKGYHYVSLTKAINAGSGRFNKNCWAQTGAGKRATGKFICKSAPRKTKRVA